LSASLPSAVLHFSADDAPRSQTAAKSFGYHVRVGIVFGRKGYAATFAVCHQIEPLEGDQQM
jgi:hypothetical protein